MKAAVLYKPGDRLVVEEVEIDQPRSDEVLIEVKASGLCHSDLHSIKGDLPTPLPVVLGHEAAGIVKAVGSSVRNLAVGDHVVTCASIFCGECERCVTGYTHLCNNRPGRTAQDNPCLRLNGETLWQAGQLGGFAEQMLVHKHALVKIPNEMPLDRAALLGCGVLTGLGCVFNTAKILPGSTVAVLGCGGVGLNVIQGARIAGASRIIAIDLSPYKLELAKELGATDVIQGGAGADEEVRSLTNGGVNFAFEVIGFRQTVEQAIAMLAPRGVLTVVGALPMGQTFEVPGIQMLMNELKVQGAMMGSSPFMVDIPRYVSLYQRGELALDLLVSEHIALDEINEAYERLESGGIARSVIVFN